MTSRQPLLIEIGCEEIPARMIRGAAAELAARVLQILDHAGLEHGAEHHWGGSRRLAVRVDEVQERQPDRVERVLGPPAKVAFDEAGSLTRAGLGFAKKQGVAPEKLEAEETPKGVYVGFTRQVEGQTIGAVLAEALPRAVGGMRFPKSMRWGDGTHRWVRPVHWLLILHGEAVLPVELFGVASAGTSSGHRFLAEGPVVISHPDHYAPGLEKAGVLVDPQQRRERLAGSLAAGAEAAGGKPVEDAGLLDEVVDLVEWPGVVTGRFDADFLDLPRELLVTTLRHHQKCFSVQDGQGKLLPAFLAVANTDRDESGHIRRGNEWVVSGRLEDARFFWAEDRRSTLESRAAALEGVVFHARCGTFADKAERTGRLAAEIAGRLGLSEDEIAAARRAARLAKVDLVTSLVGEFPELQGVIGGLLLERDGEGAGVVRAVYEHYRPAGPEDALPTQPAARVVAIADKLDTIAALIATGERPSGSRDPLGLRRAANGILRIAIEAGLTLSLQSLVEIAASSGGGPADPRARETILQFLRERLVGHLRELGYSPNEIQAVIRPRISEQDVDGWLLGEIVARLEALTEVRGREDFRHLVKLTERVDNILTKNDEKFREIATRAAGDDYREEKEASVALAELIRECGPRISRESDQGRYAEVIEILSRFIAPVDRFFEDVLVLDPEDAAATTHRHGLLAQLRIILTSYFDIRELSGQSDRRAA